MKILLILTATIAIAGSSICLFGSDYMPNSRSVNNFYYIDSSLTFKFLDQTDSVFLTYNKYEYNEQNNETSHKIYKWSESDELWKISQQLETGYDANGLDTSFISMFHNNGLTNGSKTITIYNEYGITLNSTNYTYKNNAWIKSQFTMNYLNDLGKPDSIITTNFNENGVIINSTKTNNYYAINRLDSVMVFNLDTINDSWVKNRKSVLQYQSNGGFTLTSNWDTLTKTWKEYIKVENYKDINGYDSLLTSLIYVSDSAKWYYKTLVSTNYDATGKILNGKNLYYFYNTDSWICNDSTLYSYNTNNQLIEEVSYKCENVVDTIPYARAENFYDKYGNRTIRTTYVYESADWKLSLKTYYSYINPEDNNNINSTKEKFSCSILCYPNPVKNKLNFIGEFINPIVLIYTYDGKQLGTEIINERSIDLTNYPSGFYIIQVKEKNKTIGSIKIIKE